MLTKYHLDPNVTLAILTIGRRSKKKVDVRAPRGAEKMPAGTRACKTVPIAGQSAAEAALESYTEKRSAIEGGKSAALVRCAAFYKVVTVLLSIIIRSQHALAARI